MLLAEVVAATVQSNNFYAADRFEITLALETDDPSAMAFWLKEPEIEVEVAFQQTSGSPFIPAIRGKADLVSVDPIAGLLRAEGRDLSACLIDSVLAETFSNRTASGIVSDIASRHELAPVVEPTVRIIGRYYQGEHGAMMLDNFSGRATEWDFLAVLAEMESYDLYVAGKSLYFQPQKPMQVPSFVFRPGDLIRLTLERVMTLSGGVEVTVKSWDSRQHCAVVENAERAATGSSANQVRHVLIRPNLAADSAQQLAARTLADLCRHQRSVEMTMPGELQLLPRSIIMLAGLGAEFGQVLSG